MKLISKRVRRYNDNKSNHILGHNVSLKNIVTIWVILIDKNENTSNCIEVTPANIWVTKYAPLTSLDVKSFIT